MKIIQQTGLILLFIVLVTACKQEPQSPEELKDKIFQTKQELADLEAEYEALIKNKESEEGVINVRISKAEREYVEHVFRVTGIAEAEKMAFISPETNGLIQKIHVREGQRVKAGQLLISLKSSVLLSSISEVKKNLELAETMFQKQKRLYEQGVGKEVEYLQAKNQKESLEAKLRTLNAQLAMSKITAPFSGIVDKIEAKQGEQATPARPIIQMVNLNRIIIEADIAERYIPVINEGSHAKVTVNAYPGLEFDTKVARTGNIINPTNRTFAAEVRIDNTEGKIKPNMVCELHLTDYSGEEILVPSNIIQNDKNGKYIYIAIEQDGKYLAQKKYITTGFTIGSMMVAEDGIKEGDLIITDGSNLVSNGIEISVTE
jgi:RND family efflux transporter MFP subunit